MVEHADGFRLAEIDLELRSEGELVGTRQSGLGQFEVACLPEDAALLERARARAEAIVATDPELEGPEHALLGEALAHAVGRRGARADPGVRVIAGRWGGRRLKAPKGTATTRPTSERVREAVFSMLGTVEGAERARPVRRHRRAGDRGAVEGREAGRVRRARRARAAERWRAIWRLFGSRRARPRCGAERRSARCGEHERARRHTIWSSSTPRTGGRATWDASCRWPWRRCWRQRRASSSRATGERRSSCRGRSCSSGAMATLRSQSTVTNDLLT